MARIAAHSGALVRIGIRFRYTVGRSGLVRFSRCGYARRPAAATDAWAPRTRRDNPCAGSATAGRLAGSSERHPVQTVEQGPGILLVTGLARIVRAQRHAAHTGQLLGRNLGILLAIELLPEVLVEPAAIHLGLRRRRAGHHAECDEPDESRSEHAFLRLPVLELGLETQP